nr:uncharacterized protein LOC110282058 [Parasteatoda tepidariorum]
MEYNINYELDGGDKLINLCLWANLHRAFRKRGLEILHFKFHLPSEVVEEDCAIRLLFLDFNHISLEKQALRKEPNNVTSKTEADGSQFIDQKEYFLSGGILHFDLLAIPKLTVRQKGITYIYREQPVLKRIPYKQAVQLRPFLSLDKKSTIQGIQEPILEEGEEIKKFEEDEEKVPFTSQEELEQLEKDEVKVPSSSTEETDALEGVEKVQSNSGEAILPNKAIFWETPKPSRLCPENNRFASEGIYDVEYNPENKEVSFKTSQFGTFGFFQRRHLNLSYKTWYFSAGDIPELSLKGQYYSIKIRISSQGCQLLSLNPNNDYIPSKLFNEWLCVEKFIQELQEIGINIHVDDVNSYSQSFLKNRELESNIYDCIALLSNICDFGSIEQNQTVSEEEFILKYRLSNLPKFAGNLFFLISEESDEKIVRL